MTPSEHAVLLQLAQDTVTIIHQQVASSELMWSEMAVIRHGIEGGTLNREYGLQLWKETQQRNRERQRVLWLEGNTVQAEGDRILANTTVATPND